MPDLGLEIEDFQAQTWKIENWSQTAKRMVGPEFSCGGHKWYISLLCPKLQSQSARLTLNQAHPAVPNGQREWPTE
jgi:ubiquitin carboxyl-terminal hydrolase 7